MKLLATGRLRRRFPAVLLLACLALASAACGAEARFLLLHTNDLHDHVRPGHGGVGGLPWVARYVAAVRASRPDVVLVDAGDVVEKGDLVAHRTRGELTYELLRPLGYHAVTIGNHDHDQGIAQLRRYAAALGQPFVCLNAVDGDGRAWFDEHRVVALGDLRVAIVGLMVPQDAGTLDFAESARRLAGLAHRLKQENHVVIAVCHHAAAACLAWSRLAPDVDVFVSGHSHEFIETPVTAPVTGALIVQAGCYAKAVGRVELAVDLATKRVRMLEGGLVHLPHERHEPDAAVLARVQACERELAPEAADRLLDNPRPLGLEIAWLAAEAIRRDAQAEVGFCHPGHIIRDRLPAGPVDVNAVFLTGGQRGEKVVMAELSGAEIAAYVQALESGRDPAAWAGFTLAPDGTGSLAPARRYRVAMPALEWEKRFLRAAARAKGEGPLGAGAFTAQPVATTYTDAIVAWLRQLPAEQRDVHALAAAVRQAGGR